MPVCSVSLYDTSMVRLSPKAEKVTSEVLNVAFREVLGKK